MKTLEMVAAAALCTTWLTPAFAADLAFTGAIVIDTETGAETPGQTILITGDRIENILPDGSDYEASRTVDITGRYVVPGYLDMHAHPLNIPDPSDVHALMLAKGITGYRQMSGTDTLLRARAAGQDLAPQPAPEILTLPGEILTGGNTHTAQDAAAHLAHQKDLGADMIKIVDMAPEVWLETVRLARTAGLPIAGHMPPSVATEDAVRAGLSALEHYGAGDAMMIDCSHEEDDIRNALRQSGTAEVDTHGHGAPADSHPISSARFLVNPVAFSSPEVLERFSRVERTFDAAKCAGLAEILIENDIWMVPTLIRLRTQDFGNAAEYMENPALAYMPEDTKALWFDVAETFDALSQQDQDMLGRLFDRYIEMTKILAEAGVPMLAGSDFGGGWLVPGFSLHDEFDLLGQAGLTPLQVLQSATLNGARYLDRVDSMGTVAPGKVADLVLLSENPIADVAALHSIIGVVRAGHFYDQRDLGQIMDKLRRD